MSLQDLKNEAQGYLRGSTSIVRKVGSQINVGERFTMRVTITNVAPSGSRYYFRDPWYSVFEHPEKYADLVTPNRSQVGFGGFRFPSVSRLWPGSSASLDLEFEAVRSYGDWWHDIWNKEPIADVAVGATFDYEAFFAVSVRADANHEIDPS